MPSRFREALGPPPVVDPGDHKAASSYVDHIISVTSRGGWSRVERKTLSQIKARWRLRAQGRDPRFEVVGNRAGRLTAIEQAQVERLRGLL